MKGTTRRIIGGSYSLGVGKAYADKQMVKKKMSLIEKRKIAWHKFIDDSGLINKPPWHKLIDDIYYGFEADLRKVIDEEIEIYDNKFIAKTVLNRLKLKIFGLEDVPAEGGVRQS